MLECLALIWFLRRSSACAALEVGFCPLFLLWFDRRRLTSPHGFRMERDDIIRRIWRELEPELREQGYELVEVEYAPQRGARIVRLYIDRTVQPAAAHVVSGSGITLDDCQAASQLAGSLLDKADFLDGRYALEVSSPGLARPVRSPADFVRFAGERVKLSAQAAVSGRRQFNGVLRGFADGLVRVECDGTVYEVHIENVKKANLVSG